MTKDNSGKDFSCKMNKGLLNVDVILPVSAAGLLNANIQYEGKKI